jgi:hypothetical protein
MKMKVDGLDDRSTSSSFCHSLFTLSFVVRLEDLEDIGDQDPEITPGLFEGDQAIDNELFSYFRVGLKWDVFPEKLWPNRT